MSLIHPGAPPRHGQSVFNGGRIMCQPQLKVRIVVGIPVRIERCLGPESMSMRACSSRSFESAYFTRHLDFVLIPGGDVNCAIDVIEFHAAVGSEA